GCWVVHPLCQPQIAEHYVAYVNVIADHGAVAAQDRPIAVESRANGSWDDPIEVQISTAEEIGGARDTNRQPVSVMVGLGQQVGAALRNIIWVPSVKRHFLIVG